MLACKVVASFIIRGCGSFILKSAFALIVGVGINLISSTEAFANTEQSNIERDLIKRALFGYSSMWSVRSGDRIDFKISDYRPGTNQYEAQLVRLKFRNGVTPGTSFAEDELDAPFNGLYKGQNQKIYPGSYVEIADPVPLDKLGSFTLLAAIAPSLLPTEDRKPWAEFQHIINRWNDLVKSGWSLGIDDKGHLTFLSASDDGHVEKISLSVPLYENKWVRIAVIYDATKEELTLRQIPVAMSPGERYALKGQTLTSRMSLPSQVGPLRFGAASGVIGNDGRPHAAGSYNGKLDQVRLIKGALNYEEIDKLQALKKPVLSLSGKSFLGFWDFGKGIDTTKVFDLSRNKLHGETVNIPGRAVTGINWSGESLNWKTHPGHYSAIHFHEDDVYDAGWNTDFSYTIPADLKSGVYAARLRGGEAEDYIPFFVLPPRKGTKAKVALLLPTNTYLAYANSIPHVMGGLPALVTDSNGETQKVIETHAITGGDTSYSSFLLAHKEYPGGVYRTHTDGTHNRHASILYPSYTIRPNYANMRLSADLGFAGWLEHEGISYDILTDEALHEEGVSLLDSYNVVISGNHPEYVSRNEIDAVESYLDNGGRFMYLGGNGFYYVSAFHAELPGVIEVRRDLGRFSDGRERRYAFDGTASPAWEQLDRGAASLLGVIYGPPVSINGSGYYRVLQSSNNPRAQFIFEGIEEDIVGNFGKAGGGAAGIELDYASFALGTPPHALILATSENVTWPYNNYELAGVTMEKYRANFPGPKSDLVFFETPNGGAVFSVGSISWHGSLTHNGFDNNISKITTNVLKRFLDPKGF